MNNVKCLYCGHKYKITDSQLSDIYDSNITTYCPNCEKILEWNDIEELQELPDGTLISTI